MKQSSSSREYVTGAGCFGGSVGIGVAVGIGVTVGVGASVGSGVVLGIGLGVGLGVGVFVGVGFAVGVGFGLSAAPEGVGVPVIFGVTLPVTSPPFGVTADGFGPVVACGPGSFVTSGVFFGVADNCAEVGWAASSGIFVSPPVSGTCGCFECLQPENAIQAENRAQ